MPYFQWDISTCLCSLSGKVTGGIGDTSEFQSPISSEMSAGEANPTPIPADPVQFRSDH
jgi:hypothetical protein